MDQQQPEAAHAASEFDDEPGSSSWRASDLVLFGALLAVVLGLVALLVKVA